MGNRIESESLSLAEQGVGPLLQRDYWGVVRNAWASPRAVVATVRRYFPSFSPRDLASFERCDGRDAGLSMGDELFVTLPVAGRFLVRVTHVGDQSFTLATEPGHPESGRITFGCYRDSNDELVFHIRSRARSSSRRFRAGFLATGEVMQTSTWTDFVNRVGVAFGEGIDGFIHAATRLCEDEPERIARSEPTYMAGE